MRHTVLKGIFPTLMLIIPIGVFLMSLFMFYMNQMTMNEYDAMNMIEQSSLHEITVLKGDLCPNNKCMHLLYEKQDTLEKACVFVNPPNPTIRFICLWAQWASCLGTKSQPSRGQTSWTSQPI